jgi:anti-anti-sigma factor
MSASSLLTLRTATVAPGVVVVTASGEIDLANSAELADTLANVSDAPELKLLVCDLARVRFLACTGVSVLADIRSELDTRSVELRVVAADPVVLRVLEATGQRDVLGVRQHLTEALAGFARAPEAASSHLAQLRTALEEAVEQTSNLADLCGRLAEEVSAVDADRLVDERGEGWRPEETLVEMAEDLRVLRNHLTTGALLASPAVEDLRHLHDDGLSTSDE